MTMEEEAQRYRLWKPPLSMAERSSLPKVGIGIADHMASNEIESRLSKKKTIKRYIRVKQPPEGENEKGFGLEPMPITAEERK